MAKNGQESLQHPFHDHPLDKTSVRRLQKYYNGEECNCNGCQKPLYGKGAALNAKGRVAEDGADPNYAYHCGKCNFDLCSRCAKGDLHDFHHHYLFRASPRVVYPETDGVWLCDGCTRVFSHLTSKLSHHCHECSVDLCEECFGGKWSHTLHLVTKWNHEHRMRPVDPRIRYRIHHRWMCDNCKTSFSHGEQLEVMFQCSECGFDICSQCFLGNKHKLHIHPLVEVNATTWKRALGGGGKSGSRCSDCRKKLSPGSTAYLCRQPQCTYILCTMCFHTPPKPHPLHPLHPLDLCDAALVYPQSGGKWNCDQCSFEGCEPIEGRGPSEPMYHCEECNYDICTQCYKKQGRKEENHVEDITDDSVATTESYITASSSTNSLMNGHGHNTSQDITSQDTCVKHPVQVQEKEPVYPYTVTHGASGQKHSFHSIKPQYYSFASTTPHHSKTYARSLSFEPHKL